MSEMKAVIKKADGKENWFYTSVQRQNPGEGEVEIKVACAGICGSELHAYNDNHFYRPGNIIGHEFCGVISRVGKGVTDWKEGDRVVAEIYAGSCGECEYCKRGLIGFCQEGHYVGWDLDGGWADYHIAPQNMLHKLPDSVSFEVGTMIEPLAVLAQALVVNRRPIKAGDVVVIQGCGTIGMIAAMMAKAAGASKVIMTGTDVDNDVRLPIAKQLKSVDMIVNVMHENLKEIVLAETDGLGADVIIEASGSDKAIYTMSDIIRPLGNIVVLGESGKSEFPFRWNAALFKSCSIIFNFGEVHEAWVIALRLLEAGKFELDKLITHKLPLSEFKQGFELLDSKEGLKVILYPGEK